MRNEIRDDDIMASRPYNRRVEAAEDDTIMMMSSPTTTSIKMNGDTSSKNVDDTTLQDEVDENVTREQMKMAAKQRVKQNLDAKRIIEKAKEEVDEDSMRRTRGTSGMSSISSTSNSSTSKKRVQTASSSGLGLRPHAV